MRTTPKIHPVEAALLSVLFAAAITLPVVKQCFFGEFDTSAQEKRFLASPPVFSMGFKGKIRFLPQQIDAWFNDHFGFRALLLSTGAQLKLHYLTASGHAIVGTEGWFFFKTEAPLFSESLTAGGLEKWKHYLEFRQRWLAARGVKYLFVVAPDKDSIYPEYLPAWAGRPPPELPVDQIIRHLRETHSDVDVLSLREALLDAKKIETRPLYFKQDTHWNTLGAFYGYRAIMQNIAQYFPGLVGKKRDDFRMVISKERGRDLVFMAGLPDLPIPDCPALEQIVPRASVIEELSIPGFTGHARVSQLKSAPGKLRMLTIHDSFTNALQPYYSETFSSVTFMQMGFNRAGDEKVFAQTILEQKPDIVIEESIQRYVILLPDANSVFGGEDKAGPVDERH